MATPNKEIVKETASKTKAVSAAKKTKAKAVRKSKPAAKSKKTASAAPATKSEAKPKPKSESVYVSLTPPNKAMEQVMTKSKNQFDQFTNEATAASREGMEALMKCGTIWMKGCEEIVQTATSLTQKNAEKQSQYVKEALSAKTLNEWAETQNKIAQANFDDFMQGATKITELSVKVLTEVSEPFNAQITKTVKKATDSVAA